VVFSLAEGVEPVPETRPSRITSSDVPATGFFSLRHRPQVPLLAAIPAGRERRDGGLLQSRHTHAGAYAAVVLAGGYEETGNRGRFRVHAGDVLFHDAFDAHLNRFDPHGATILNLALTGTANGLRAGRVSDADAIVRTAERDPQVAVHVLEAQLREIHPVVDDWPDLLATEIVRDPSCRLDRWADAHDIVPETLSRGFARVYGTTPATFRAEARARRAFRQIVNTGTSLVEISSVVGFADQAHMTRAVRILTGATPTYWRSTSNSFKTLPA
jgi:AraC-like DNA-binding protein